MATKFFKAVNAHTKGEREKWARTLAEVQRGSTAISVFAEKWMCRPLGDRGKCKRTKTGKHVRGGESADTKCGLQLIPKDPFIKCIDVNRGEEEHAVLIRDERELYFYAVNYPTQIV